MSFTDAVNHPIKLTRPSLCIISQRPTGNRDDFHHDCTPVNPCQARTLPPVAYHPLGHQAQLLPWGGTEPAYPLQHLLEHLPRHRHLYKVKLQPPGVAHQTPTYLD